MTDTLRYIERIPSVAEFQNLRTNVGWGIPPESVLKEALAKSIFGICVETLDGTTIGMGRLVGDGGIQVFITDVIVHKQWQNLGLGTQIMTLLMDHVRNTASPATFVGLFSAFGRDKFYEKFGFIVRPNEALGPGMMFVHSEPEQK